MHVAFRRENPTVRKRDFTIAEGLRGPGRYLGCSVGIRTLPQKHFAWYGEGELKIYRDGDGSHPTICGTGLEDYVGTAWGMGSHFAPYGGVPLDLRAPDSGPIPDFVSFYRWHVTDPVVFHRDLRVTIQQIGYAAVPLGTPEAELESLEAAGAGWARDNPGVVAHGIAERSDDYCDCAYVYCRDAQPVPRVDMKLATADIERRPYESAQPIEILMASISPG